MRILIVGDAVGATGFTRVIRGVFSSLAGCFELHQLAVNYNGDPHDYEWKLYPAIAGGDKYGYARLPELVARLNPDLIYILGNFTSLARYLHALREVDHRARVLAYCPIEGGPIEPTVLGHLTDVDQLVVYTPHARRIVGEAVNQSSDAAIRRAFTDVRVVPHGVDTDQFHPLTPAVPDSTYYKASAKRLMFGDDRELVDSFIVLNANRNQPRKRIDTTIEGFAKFARGKPDNVKLYLHMGLQDVGWNIVALARRHAIESRLLLTSRSAGVPDLSTEQLNVLYNACDVGINTASAEGWGLVAFEHAATRSAQVVPGHGWCAEVWRGKAEVLEPAFRATEPQTLTDAYYISAEEVASKLERLYRDRELRDRVAGAGYDLVSQPEFSWRSISSQWSDLFHELLARPAGPREAHPGGSAVGTRG